ncbi:hypothetical protein IQ508_000764 [Salmonella enterica]|nr:hypothetical protein [Salmonella enterica]EEF9468813.1 hypothetical protein [Salmonella enterica]EGL4564788.1 hypothetical protein [Salmonella enterica]EGL4582799.1 hypothetical protein [Salmonella enterica]EGL4632024.1 hypothetical protein [Salmonella enterica]
MPLLVAVFALLYDIGVWLVGLLIPALIYVFASKYIFSRVVVGLTLAFYVSVFLAFTTFLNTRFATLLNSVGFFDNPYFLTGVSLLPSNISVCISIFSVVYLSYLILRFKILVVNAYSKQSSQSSGLPVKTKKP